jgi:hypothetical protein
MISLVLHLLKLDIRLLEEAESPKEERRKGGKSKEE